MNKKIFFILTILYFSFSVSQCKKSEEVTADSIKVWKANHFINYRSIELGDNQKLSYTIEAIEGPGGFYNGTYEKTQTGFKYKIQQEEDNQNSDLPKEGSGDCTIQNSKDPIFEKQLKCTGIIDSQYYAQVRKPDSPVEISEQKAISVLKDYDIQQEVKIRKGPGINFPTQDNCISETGAFQILKNSMSIYAVARTLEKQKVDKWENYWYYIIVEPNLHYTQCSGWVFGEFIQESKNK